jgi:hypothetical protein
MECRSKKFRRNRLGTVAVIPRKKLLIPSFTEESISKLRTEWYGTTQKKLVLRNSQKSSNAVERNSGSLLVFLLHEMELRVFFNFSGMVRNGFPRAYLCFCCTKRNSEHFSFPGKKRNSDKLLLFLLHCTEYRAFFLSTE